MAFFFLKKNIIFTFFFNFLTIILNSNVLEIEIKKSRFGKGILRQDSIPLITSTETRTHHKKRWG